MIRRPKQYYDPATKTYKTCPMRSIHFICSFHHNIINNPSIAWPNTCVAPRSHDYLAGDKKVDLVTLQLGNGPDHEVTDAVFITILLAI
jgi:hypothetical protein